MYLVDLTFYNHFSFLRDLPCEKGKDCECTDLAYQLIKEHPDIHVIMGGAQAKFYPEGVTLPCDPSANGTRWDGKNLAKEWESTQKSKGRKYIYADSPETFNKINFADYDYALSKFAFHIKLY